MHFNAFDIVKVPFPFTDNKTQKKRPAVVVSGNSFQKLYKHCILCMITSAKHSSWKDDIVITDLNKAGLPCPSVIRLKLFTMDERFILGKLGQLPRQEADRLRTVLLNYLFKNE